MRTTAVILLLATGLLTGCGQRWTEFKADDGSFSCEFPDKPKIEKNADGGISVACWLPGECAYEASSIPTKDVADGEARWAKSLGFLTRLDAKLSKKDVEQGGMKGVEVRTGNLGGKNTSVFRVFITAHRTYNVAVNEPKDSPTLEADV